MKGKISEVFESIQGEGIYFGERQIFVRFFGCNLECKFCDTKAERFMEYEPQELLAEIKLYPNSIHSISFTGGEPLAQKDFLREFLILIRREGYKSYLETNGTLSDELIQVVDLLDIVAMDIKLPSSSGMGDLWDKHRRFLEIASQKEVFVKTIICLKTEENDLRKMLALVKEINNSAVLVLQPNSHEESTELSDKLSSFKEICRKEQISVCVIPQLHKVIGVR